jgi:hypothetical protein
MRNVSMKALIARINRKLASCDDGWERVRTRRGSRWSELGRYYAINVSGNYLTAKDIDPETWGRELRVLLPGESVLAV